MSLRGHSIIEAQQFADPALLEEFYELAMHYKDMLSRKERGTCLRGKAFGMVFYEPSTRTRWSFEAAVRNLGGEYSSTDNAGEFSSAAKGERLEHSIRVMSAYVDAFVLRHKQDNGAEVARDYLQSFGIDTPIFNAGCGMGQHPTQALVDWLTIRQELGRTDHMHVVMVGDLARGRTARSLAYLLGRAPGVKIDFVAPAQLAMGHDILAYLKRHNVPYREFGSIDEVIGLADVVYVTRVQKERPHGSADLSKIDPSRFKVTVDRALRMKRGACLMHPLPIFDEVEEAVDRLPHSAYFRQSDNGVPVRMALLDMVMC